MGEIMSDNSLKVDCPIHGKSFATFVCQHLVNGKGRGFFFADDPSDSHPDAWCADCEQIRDEEGGWTDRAEDFAKVTVLCAGCYEVVKSRNQDGNRQPPEGFVCQTCGEFHPELPMDFGYEVPYAYQKIPQDEREARCELTPDLCVIDKKEFFIRGCLEIPVVDGPRSFVWGVWTSLSEKSFRRTVEIWETDGRENEPPFFGWLCTSLPLYPETLLLKTHVHTRPLNQRPFIELEPTDHPLAVEQRNGITMERVREIVERMLHGRPSDEKAG